MLERNFKGNTQLMARCVFNESNKVEFDNYTQYYKKSRRNKSCKNSY